MNCSSKYRRQISRLLPALIFGYSIFLASRLCAAADDRVIISSGLYSANWRSDYDKLAMKLKSPGKEDVRPLYGKDHDGLAALPTLHAAGLVISIQSIDTFSGWPVDKAGISTGTHVDVWLRDVSEPVLPPIAWGWKWWYGEFKTEDDCRSMGQRDGGTNADADVVDNCRAWFKAQVTYQDTLKKLFTRRWSIAPGMASETYASRIWEVQEENVKKELGVLKPHGENLIASEFTLIPDKRFSAQILIPWEAFPPMTDLKLSSVAIEIEVYDAAENKVTMSTAMLERSGDAPEKLSEFKLPEPVEFRITPCRYGLADFVLTTPKRSTHDPSPGAAAFYFPTQSRKVDKVIVMDNQIGGYMREPGDEDYSPRLSEAPFWSKQIPGGKDDFLCGPKLALKMGEKISRTDFDVSFKEYAHVLKTKDSIMVKAGPWVDLSYYGTGQCGACPRLNLRMFSFDRTDAMQGHDLFWYNAALDPESSYARINISKDWKTIHIYGWSDSYSDDEPGEKEEESGAGWREYKHCLDRAQNRFVECGTIKNFPESKLPLSPDMNGISFF